MVSSYMNVALHSAVFTFAVVHVMQSNVHDGSVAGVAVHPAEHDEVNGMKYLRELSVRNI
ncbi:MAG: hypothetical protein IPG99_15185 [Ignavibacteria bacterium]|nr:hypothetical protein [Ignavibacteria bacterium]